MRKTIKLLTALGVLLLLPAFSANAFVQEGEAYVLDESGKTPISIPTPYVPAGQESICS